MNIEFTPMSIEQCLTPFHISRKSVIDVITNYDHIEDIILEGKGGQSVLFCKLIITNTGNFYTWVHCTKTEKSLKVQRVFKIPEECYKDNSAPISPLMLLEALVSKFGLEVQVAEEKAKFILNKKIPGTGERSEIKTPKGAHGIDMQMCALVKFTNNGDEKYWECALVYAINITEYKKYI